MDVRRSLLSIAVANMELVNDNIEGKILELLAAGHELDQMQLKRIEKSNGVAVELWCAEEKQFTARLKFK